MIKFEDREQQFWDKVDKSGECKICRDEQRRRYKNAIH